MNRYLSQRWPAKAITLAICVVTGVFLIGSTSAFAQGDNPVSIALKAQRVVVADGKESFEPADKAKPGDTIEYVETCKNNTPGGIHNLKPNLPIPDGTEFVANSAKPAPTEGSLDGKKFESFPIKRKVKTADGKEELREVPASQIRVLRWTIGDLPGGTSTNVVARVRVLPAR